MVLSNTCVRTFARAQQLFLMLHYIHPQYLPLLQFRAIRVSWNLSQVTSCQFITQLTYIETSICIHIHTYGQYRAPNSQLTCMFLKCGSEQEYTDTW